MAGRGSRQPFRSGRRHASILAAFALLLFGLAVASGLPNPSSVLGIRGGGPAASGLRPESGGSLCGTLFPNATLNASVAGVYANLASEPGSTNRSGPAGNGSAGNASLPSEANATLEVEGWWAEVCTSTPFAAAIAEWGDANFSWWTTSMPGAASWSFGVLWTSSCDLAPQGNVTGGCVFREYWTGNLGSASAEGPVTTITAPCGPTACPGYPLTRSTTSPGVPHAGPFLSGEDAGVLLGVALGLAAGGAVAVLRRRRGRSGSADEPDPAGPEGRGESDLDEAEPFRDAF